MENINGKNNDIAKIAEQYKSLHSASGANSDELEKLDDSSLFLLFQKDMEDGYLNGQYTTDNGSESIFNGFSKQVTDNMDDFLSSSPELRNGVINELAQDVVNGEKIFFWQNPETGKYESNPKFKNMELEVAHRADEIMNGTSFNDIPVQNNETNTFNQLIPGLKSMGIDENTLKEMKYEDLNTILQNSFENGKLNPKAFLNEVANRYGNFSPSNTSGYLNSTSVLDDKLEKFIAGLMDYVSGQDNQGIQFGGDFVNKYHDEKSSELENLAKLGYKVLDETAEYTGDWQKANEKSEAYKSQISSIESQIQAHNEQEPVRSNFDSEASYNKAKQEWSLQGENLSKQLQFTTSRYNEHEVARMEIIREANEAVAGEDKNVITRADSPEIVQFKMSRQKYDTKLEASSLETQLNDINTKLDKTANEYDKRELLSQKTELENKLKIAKEKIKNFGGDDDETPTNFVNKYHDAKSAELENLANQGYQVIDETAVYNQDWRGANQKRDEIEAQLSNLNTQAMTHRNNEPQRNNFANDADYNAAKTNWLIKNLSLDNNINSLKSQLEMNEKQRMDLINDANSKAAGDDKTIITRADTPSVIEEKKALQRQNVQNEINSCKQQLENLNKAQNTSGAFTQKETEDLNVKKADLEAKLKAAEERFAKFGNIY